mgnify:CR=1 FL=1
MQQTQSGGLNLDNIMRKLGERTQSSEKNLNEITESLDPSDPTAMLEFQKVLHEWTLATDLQSSSLKNIVYISWPFSPSLELYKQSKHRTDQFAKYMPSK